MSSQITLLGDQGDSSVDTLVPLPGEFPSSSQRSVWYSPEGSTDIIAVTNVSNQPAEAILRSLTDAREEKLTLAAHATTQIRLVERDVVHGFVLDHNAHPGALLMAGISRWPNGSRTPINLYDKAFTIQKDLFALNVPVRNCHLKMALLHGGTGSLSGTAEFTPLDVEGEPVGISLPQLAKDKPALLDVSSFEGLASKSAADSYGVHVLFNGNTGDLVGSIASVCEQPGSAGTVTGTGPSTAVSMPLRDSGRVLRSTGNYPVFFEEGYENVITIENVSSVKQRFGAYLEIGAIRYVFGVQNVEPNQSVRLRPNDLQHKNIADPFGTQIPKSAKLGKFRWSVIPSQAGRFSDAVLIGRNQVINNEKKIFSSFSCGIACPSNFNGPTLNGTLPALLPAPQKAGFGVTSVMYDSGGNSTVLLANLYASNSNPSSIQMDDSLGMFSLTAVSSPGSTFDWYVQNDTVSYDSVDCFVIPSSYSATASVGVPDSVPIVAGINPLVWTPGTTTTVTIDGSNFGNTSPSLSFDPADGISYSIVSASDSQIVTNISVADGTAAREVLVSVTSNGYVGDGFAPIGSQQPKRGNSVYASIRLRLDSPRVTVIGWLDGPGIAVPSGASPEIVSILNDSMACAFQATRWYLGFDLNRPPADLRYAALLFLSRTGNNRPPPTIDPQQQYDAGDYRLFNDWGGLSGGLAKVGKTKDPCGVLPAVAPDTSRYHGSHGISLSGKLFQLAQGRVGSLGAKLSTSLLPGTTVPWIWSAIEFDLSGNPVIPPPQEIFPTYFIYKDGVLQQTYPQADAETFIQKGETNQLTPANVP